MLVLQPRPYTVSLVTNVPLLRLGWRFLLQDAPDVVLQGRYTHAEMRAGSGDETIDGVLIDASTDLREALRTIHFLRDRRPDPAILVVTSRGDAAGGRPTYAIDFPAAGAQKCIEISRMNGAAVVTALTAHLENALPH